MALICCNYLTANELPGSALAKRRRQCGAGASGLVKPRLTVRTLGAHDFLSPFPARSGIDGVHRKGVPPNSYVAWVGAAASAECQWRERHCDAHKLNRGDFELWPRGAHGTRLGPVL
jgi:hypothetical protein